MASARAAQKHFCAKRLTIFITWCLGDKSDWSSLMSFRCPSGPLMANSGLLRCLFVALGAGGPSYVWKRKFIRTGRSCENNPPDWHYFTAHRTKAWFMCDVEETGAIASLIQTNLNHFFAAATLSGVPDCSIWSPLLLDVLYWRACRYMRPYFHSLNWTNCSLSHWHWW